jgi:hypothetical protein
MVMSRSPVTHATCSTKLKAWPVECVNRTMAHRVEKHEQLANEKRGRRKYRKGYIVSSSQCQKGTIQLDVHCVRSLKPKGAAIEPDRNGSRNLVITVLHHADVIHTLQCFAGCSCSETVRLIDQILAPSSKQCNYNTVS